MCLLHGTAIFRDQLLRANLVLRLFRERYGLARIILGSTEGLICHFSTLPGRVAFDDDCFDLFDFLLWQFCCDHSRYLSDEALPTIVCAGSRARQWALTFDLFLELEHVLKVDVRCRRSFKGALVALR